MAPAVILIGCLLATMSCLTTAQSTTPPTTGQTETAAVLTPDTTTTTTSVTSIPATTPPASTTTTTPTPLTTTTAIPVLQPTHGSCGNPDLCCSGFNGSCHRLNCFCDVACLRLHDCCPDFKPTCLTVNNSTNSTKPNTLPLTGTCSEPTLCCSAVNYTCFRGCFCDEACKQLNDCCPDLNSTCIFNTTTAAPPVISTTNPPVISTTNPPVTSTTNPPFGPTADPPFNPSTTPPVTSTAAPPKVLTILEMKVLTKSSTDEERQAALRQVAALLESYLRENNTGIYSFEVTSIKPVSSSP